MPLKIYYKDHIYRLSQLPATVEELLQTINNLYGKSLPPSWIVQYVDSDGDKVVISHPEDLKELQSMESQLKEGNATLKLYISQIENSRVENTSYQNLEESKSFINDEDKGLLSKESVTDKKINYPVLSGPYESEANKGNTLANSQNEKSSQYQGEQMVNSKYPQFSQEAANKSNNCLHRAGKDWKRKHSRGKSHDRKKRSHSKDGNGNVHEFIKLTKGLAKGKFNPEETRKVDERIAELEALMTAEEKQFIEERKQRWLLKKAAREAQGEEFHKEKKGWKHWFGFGGHREHHKGHGHHHRGHHDKGHHHGEHKDWKEKKFEKKSLMVKAFKKFQKIRRAYGKGNTEKVNKCIGKLSAFIPEENAQVFNTLISSVVTITKEQNTNMDVFEQELKKVEQVFVELCGPNEEKDKRIEEWKNIEDLWKMKWEHKMGKKDFKDFKRGSGKFHHRKHEFGGDNANHKAHL